MVSIQSSGTFQLASAPDNETVASATVDDSAINGNTWNVHLTPKTSGGARKESTLHGSGVAKVYVDTVSTSGSGSFVVKGDPSGVPQNDQVYHYLVVDG